MIEYCGFPLVLSKIFLWYILVVPTIGVVVEMGTGEIGPSSTGVDNASLFSMFLSFGWLIPMVIFLTFNMSGRASPSKKSKTSRDKTVFKYSGKNRLHIWEAGDRYICPGCGNPFKNTDHMYKEDGCVEMKALKKINDACRRAYLFLLKRHNSNGGTWGSPGNPLFFSGQAIRQIFVGHITPDDIISQPDDWTILEPVVVRLPNGSYRTLKLIYEYMGDLILENNLDENSIYVKMFDNEAANLETWELYEDEVNVSLQYNVQGKSLLMEAGREYLLRKYPQRFNPLPCTLTADGTVAVPRPATTVPDIQSYPYLQRIRGFTNQGLFPTGDVFGPLRVPPQAPPGANARGGARGGGAAPAG